MSRGSSKSSKSPKRIALVDCNNFYASCERVFRPEWNERPVAVLSNNDGCIIARSNELKEAGIPMGAPYFQYRRKLDEIKAVVVSSNYTLYGDMSARVMNTLSGFAPHIEVYSIDEAWMDFTGINTASLDELGRRVVSKTYQHTGIPVSMGIASTKVLAKLANKICKKRKIPGSVFNLGGSEELDIILRSTDVSDIWGIGRRWAEKLRHQGINNALQLRDSDDSEMRQIYGVVMQRLIFELRGRQCLEFEDVEPKKQIIASRSFGKRVISIQDLAEAASSHAARAGEKLRSQNSVCGGLQVFIQTGKYNPKESYYSNSAQLSFPVPTNDTRELIAAAIAGLNSIYRDDHRYSKTGVMLVDISSHSNIQTDLFSKSTDLHSQKLMSAIDGLNQRYGKNCAFFAAQGINQTWGMKQERKTPSYTTNWNELPCVV